MTNTLISNHKINKIHCKCLVKTIPKLFKNNLYIKCLFLLYQNCDTIMLRPLEVSSYCMGTD